MKSLIPLAAAAATAFTSLAAAAPAAQAQHYDRGHHYGDRYGRHDDWRYRRAPARGEFLVYAWRCPDLREDFRDRRVTIGRLDRREDRRDRQVLSCPQSAWDWQPASGHRYGYGYRDRGPGFIPSRAYWDRRSGQYFVESRRGVYPVRIVYGRGFHQRRGYDYGYGYRDRYGYGRRHDD